ncbi:hypothetical protein RHIZO_04532 [Rhizobiaceae bacterium]|nr:hypothetical protein RHIZO_04532 [Rhizobiaceae bacterium]
MVSRMRNLENAARLAMAHADMPATTTPPAGPAAAGLLRRILTMLARLLSGH